MTTSPLRRTDRPYPASSLHIGPRRRATTLAGVLALALITTGACGGKDDTPPHAGSTVGTVLGGSASATPSTGTPTSAATPQPSAPGGDKGQQPLTYPSTAREYGLVTLAAWASGNKSRLDLLATQPAVAQFQGHGTPNSQWVVLSCAAADSAHTECNYRNAHGDDTQLTMQNSQLGHPTATTNVFVNRTAYPSAAGDYVTAFMAAWGDNNTQRMARYSSSSIAGGFIGKTPPTGTQTDATQSGDTWTVKVTGLPLGSGSWTFTVKGSKLGGGNAITAGKAD